VVSAGWRVAAAAQTHPVRRHKVVCAVQFRQRAAEVREHVLVALVCAVGVLLARDGRSAKPRAAARTRERKAACAPKLHLPQALHAPQRLLVRIHGRVALAEAPVDDAARFAVLRVHVSAARRAHMLRAQHRAFRYSCSSVRLRFSFASLRACTRLVLLPFSLRAAAASAQRRHRVRRRCSSQRSCDGAAGSQLRRGGHTHLRPTMSKWRRWLTRSKAEPPPSPPPADASPCRPILPLRCRAPPRGSREHPCARAWQHAPRRSGRRTRGC
jgi:hypothetical protein